MTVLHAGRSGNRIPTEANGFSLPPNAQIIFGAKPASYWMDIGFPSRGRGGRHVKLSTHLHVVVRLGMNRVYPSFPYMPSRRGQGNFASFKLKFLTGDALLKSLSISVSYAYNVLSFWSHALRQSAFSGYGCIAVLMSNCLRGGFALVIAALHKPCGVYWCLRSMKANFKRI
jgi:hypothetical protein